MKGQNSLFDYDYNNNFLCAACAYRFQSLLQGRDTKSMQVTVQECAMQFPCVVFQFKVSVNECF